MTIQAKSILDGGSLKFWRIAQILIGLIGLYIFCSLIFFPKIGIHLFWNILISIAPLLVIIASGVWRNVCPLASTSLLLNHIVLSKNKRLKVKQRRKIKRLKTLLI